jgi:ABC-type glycerol-3-phosphate transport system permease component
MVRGLTAKDLQRKRADSRRYAIQRWTNIVLVHGAVVLAAGVIGFPFYYMLSTSLKTVGEVYSVPLVLFPAQLQWQNYVEVWNLLPFGRFTLNSVIYTTSITLGEFTMGLTAGFAFARLRFPKRDLLFFVVLLTFMIPGEITLIPRFILLKEFQWINTYQGLIVPEMSSAFATFLLREHFRSLPDELFEAAKMDGAGYVRQLVQVALPISKPIVSTLLLLATVAHWNAYLWPLIVTNSRDMRTLPIGVQSLRYILEFPEWQLIMAGATIVVLPLVILFLIAQKQFMEGAVQGAIKS